MGAQSVTGAGSGDSRKLTTTELAILANAPSILVSGVIRSVEGVPSSPPSSPSAMVVFPTPFPGMDYNVFLTTKNGGAAYVTLMDEDDDGNFSGFSVAAETECDVMYMVTKIGFRPNF